MTWPLEPSAIRAFAEGLELVVVVEEKRALVERQLREYLYNWDAARRPKIAGKADIHDAPLLPSTGELNPGIVAAALARVLRPFKEAGDLAARLDAITGRQRPDSLPGWPVSRRPYFCSGCPHNLSTKVPEGSAAGGGIGCHVMVLGQGRNTDTFTQMGGEGVHWVGLSHFTDTPHMFQNLGDGTYQHSGSLAIRQAVVAGTTITFKILYNDAVAMTGGQPIQRPLSPRDIVRQVRAEGVQRVAVVAVDPTVLSGDELFREPGVSLHDRDALEAVQRELRGHSGVSVLLYVQTCAAESRRRSKKSPVQATQKFTFINDRVCEGCGDCSRQSNCIAVEPLNTFYGRKRAINQSSCNRDLSCVSGFCPSFVTIEAAGLHPPDSTALRAAETELFAALPNSFPSAQAANILVAGIGGNGVLTVGAILGMAAHLEGRWVSVLNFTGLAQKSGAVVSHVRVSETAMPLATARLQEKSADLLLAYDVVAASAAMALPYLSTSRTAAAVNSAEIPTADFIQDPDVAVPFSEMQEALRQRTRSFEMHDVGRYAELLFGDTMAANMLLLGVASQKQLLPVSVESLKRAIELNGVAVSQNIRAFDWGRVAVHNPERFLSRAHGTAAPSKQANGVEEMSRFLRELTEYQDASYAARFLAIVKEARLTGDEDVVWVVARNLFKLMTYKDEYEVARLYTTGPFIEELRTRFGNFKKLTFHFAPPLLSRRDPISGNRLKRSFGARWIWPLLRVLTQLKSLRGRWCDPFSYQAERRVERALISDYETICRQILPHYGHATRERVLRLLSYPDSIRGYGHIKLESVSRAYASLESTASYLGCGFGRLLAAKVS